MANPRPKKKVTDNGKTRKNLRLPSDLDTWVTQYARDNHTSVTQILVDYLISLRASVEDGRVEQY